MNRTRRIAALAISAYLLIVSSVMVMDMAQPYHPVVEVSEDDPNWDCYEQGNRICGDPAGAHEDDAWTQWNTVNGSRYLRVDGTRPHRVDYVGTAKLAPKLETNEGAVPARDVWYVFRVVYLDGK